MAKSEYITAPLNIKGMPPGVPYIIGSEAAERFSYYGMNSILTIFMTKYLLDKMGHLSAMQPVAAEACKIQFVQKGRIQLCKLIALETIDNVRWRRTDVERFQLFGNRIESIEGIAVVMLVMALDESRCDAIQRPGSTIQRRDLVLHLLLHEVREV